MITLLGVHSILNIPERSLQRYVQEREILSTTLKEYIDINVHPNEQVSFDEVSL